MGQNPDEDGAMMRLEETSTISSEDKRLLGEVKEVVRQLLPTAEVYLYGSVARGTHGAESDYDFLVVADEPLATRDEETIWDAVFEVEMARGVPLSGQDKDRYREAQYRLATRQKSPDIARDTFTKNAVAVGEREAARLAILGGRS